MSMKVDRTECFLFTAEEVEGYCSRALSKHHIISTVRDSNEVVFTFRLTRDQINKILWENAVAPSGLRVKYKESESEVEYNHLEDGSIRVCITWKSYKEEEEEKKDES